MPRAPGRRPARARRPRVPRHACEEGHIALFAGRFHLRSPVSAPSPASTRLGSASGLCHAVGLPIRKKVTWVMRPGLGRAFSRFPLPVNRSLFLATAFACTRAQQQLLPTTDRRQSAVWLARRLAQALGHLESTEEAATSSAGAGHFQMMKTDADLKRQTVTRPT